MNELVNLLVDLQSLQFEPRAQARAFHALERAGASLSQEPSEQFFAWIDAEFGGAWSSEAAAGNNVIARDDRGFAAFATYDARGMHYRWLRGVAREPGTGIFGPIGVTRDLRGRGLGAAAALAALAALRNAGYARAIVPAVGSEDLVAFYAHVCGASVAERFAKLPSRRYKTVVLASGNGSNFQAIADGVRLGTLPLDLQLLVCNKADAFVLERARASNVSERNVIWRRTEESRDAYDARLLSAVEAAQPELVLLLGWMHLLDRRFIARFEHILNIHPAFLPLDESRDTVTFPDGTVTPSFRGPRAVADALAWGSSWVGASVHRVTAATDRGPLLTRAPLQVQGGETEAEVLRRLHPLEHRVLHAAVLRWMYEQPG